jgi:hypothetical protein
LSQYLKPSVNDYENDLLQSLINDDNDNEVDLNNNDIISALSFPRQHRYDTKKPGPSYYIHETDSDSQETDSLNPEVNYFLIIKSNQIWYLKNISSIISLHKIYFNFKILIQKILNFISIKIQTLSIFNKLFIDLIFMFVRVLCFIEIKYLIIMY